MPRALLFPSDQLAQMFPRHIRERGEEYWARGLVKVTFGDAREVEATVQGTRPYTVEIEKVGGRLSMHCSCEAFAGGQRCKHLWAVLMAADQEGYLTTDIASGANTSAAAGSTRESRGPLGTPAPPPPEPPAWEKRLHNLTRPDADAPAARATRTISPSNEYLYVIEATSTRVQEALTVFIGERKPLKKGGWTKVQPLVYDEATALAAARAADREIIGWLASSRGAASPWQSGYDGDLVHYRLQGPLARHVVPMLCATGRLYLRRHPSNPDLVGPLSWDDGPAWELTIEVRPETPSYVIDGALVRGAERRPLASTDLLIDGLAFIDSSVARAEIGGGAAWLAALGTADRLVVPKEEGPRLQLMLAEAPRPVRLELPPELRIDEVRVAPRVRLRIDTPRSDWGRSGHLRALELSFDYDGVIVAEPDRRTRLHDPQRGRLLVRDRDAERGAFDQLRALGAQVDPWASRDSPALVLADTKLRGALRELMRAGWHVDVQGHRYLVAQGLRFGVSSGIDWFDVRGDVTFEDGSSMPMAAILDALRHGAGEARLNNGDTVLLPDDWSRRFGFLARIGDRAEDGLRFTQRQVGLLDALLAAQPEVSVDAAFQRARTRLRRFERIEAIPAPRGFKGELRPYQREGLGWLRFLQEFGFGGCLADDMGLGKTVQVLALLQSRRGKSPHPSLVVAPRSLVFNWIDEAQRFTPGLRVVDQSGADRRRDPAAWKDADVVIVTYGTLRRDAVHLADVPFDYVILDEAQAIKNARSETAKAARLLQAEHRLALSGTPIQNHLGEVWSLFEFLNPGLLGRAGAFEAALDAGEADRALVASVLRPFLLRRTKEQVVKELPQKTEQTLYCDLEGEQLKLYRTLRDQYRASVLSAIDRQGLARSKMHVLEALLRLRQAACHSALVAPERPKPVSAKLDALVPLLAEVVDEGHKALVFSQFTSFLKLLLPLLEERGIVFEYLDGQTRDRAARVRRFQEDPACSAFLISLKAGGLGLNLTAADYVFILDPWWNPAAEAQALDRAHRIGQTRPVMAYRLIARDTVEEKVLELQQSKRALADAILTEDMSLIRGIAREDLEALLS
jgi:superfamily II DNA or RNA helicase